MRNRARPSSVYEHIRMVRHRGATWYHSVVLTWVSIGDGVVPMWALDTSAKDGDEFFFVGMQAKWNENRRVYSVLQRPGVGHALFEIEGELDHGRIVIPDSDLREMGMNNYLMLEQMMERARVIMGKPKAGAR